MKDFDQMEQWHREHIQKTLKFFNHKNPKVLVIGCNRGEECKIFFEYGVKDITGIDVIDEIGVKFISSKVQYLKQSAENMDCFKDKTFDIVYSFASFEHISDIESAFNEAWRVLKLDGVIHIFSSPLWNSPYGNHLENLFYDLPWVHLYSSKTEIYNLALKNKISFTKSQVEWLYSSNEFNRRSSLDYKYICSKFTNAELSENTISLLDKNELNKLNKTQLNKLKKHYCTDDLLGIWHLFEARKISNITNKNTNKHQKFIQYLLGTLRKFKRHTKYLLVNTLAILNR